MPSWLRISKAEWLLLSVILLSIGWIYWLCIDTRLVGFIQDDGAYIATAKALAQGQGYRQIQVAGAPWQTRYPIAYPLLLALGWLMNPQFPANLPLLTGLTTGCAILALGTCYVYFRMQQWSVWISTLLLLFLTFNLRMIFYSTAIMSEAPYLLLTVLALLLTDAPGFIQSKSRLGWVLFLSILGFHVRSIGMTLILAISLWLLLQKRYKSALGYGLLAGSLILVAWLGWQVFTASTPVNIWIFEAYGPYSTNFRDVLGQGDYLQALGLSLFLLAQKIASNFFPLAYNLPSLLPGWRLETVNWFQIYRDFALPLLSGLLIGALLLRGWRMLKTTDSAGSRLKNIPASVWYVCFYLLVILLWNESDQIPRFLVVIQPWLWMLLAFCILGIPGTRSIQHRQTGRAAFIAIALAYAVITPVAFPLVYEPRHRHWVDLGPYHNLWTDYEATFNWIKMSLPPQGAIACDRTTALYLYTDHPVFPVRPVSPSLQKQFPKQFTLTALQKTLQAHQVNYLLAEPIPIRLADGHTQRRPNPLMLALIQAYPQRFQKVFESPHRLLTLYRMR